MSAQSNIDNANITIQSLSSKIDALTENVGNLSNIVSGLNSKIDGLNEKIANLETKLDNNQSELNNLIDSIESIIKDSIGGLKDTIDKGLDGINDTINNFVSEILSTIKDIFGKGNNDNTEEIINKLRQDIGDYVESSAKIVINAINYHTTSAKDEILGYLIKDSNDNNLNDINYIKDLLEQIRRQTNPKDDKTALILAALETLEFTLLGGIAELNAAIGTLTGTVATSTGVLSGQIIGGFLTLTGLMLLGNKTILDAINALNIPQNDLGNIISYLETILKELASKTIDIQPLQDSIKIVDSKIDKVQDSINHLDYDLQDSITNLGDTITNSVTNLGDNITNSVTNLGDTVIDNVTNLGDTVIDNVTNLGDTVTNTVTNLGDTITNSVTNSVTNLGDTVTNTVTNLGDTITNSVTNLGDTVTNTVTNLGDTVTNIATTVIENPVTPPENLSGILSKYICGQSLDINPYQGMGVRGIEAMLKIINSNINNVSEMICMKEDSVASIPLAYQIKPEAMRPQLIIHYAAKKPNGTFDSAKYVITIPHFLTSLKSGFTMPKYQKGNFEIIMILSDNSKVVVNAKDELEGMKVINACKILIDKKYLEGHYIRPCGYLKSDIIVQELTPKYARFFSQGQKNMKPDWKIDL